MAPSFWSASASSSRQLPLAWRWVARVVLWLPGAALALWLWLASDALPAAWRPIAWVAAALYVAAVVAVVITGTMAYRRRAEHAATLEGRWQAILHATHLGIWDWDERLHAMYYSPSWKQMLGYAEHEIGTSLQEWMSRLHPDERDQVLAGVRRYYRSGGSGVYESVHRMRRKDGSYQWVELRGYAIERDARNRPLRFVGIQADITARRALEERLDRLAENVPGLLFQYRRDADGHDRFVYCTDKVREIYGLTPEQLQRSAEPLAKRVHPDDLGPLLRSIAESARTLGVWQLAYRVVLPGRGERWISGMARPQRLDDGATVWHGYLHDATEERQLRERLDRLVQDVPGMLYQLRMEPGGRQWFPYVSRNSQAVYGLTAERMREDPAAVFALIEPDDLYSGQRKLEASARAHSEWVHEFRVKLPGGGERWLSARAQPQRVAGDAVLWNGYMQDVTAIKQQELQLQESERLLNHLMREMPIGLCMVNAAGQIYFRNRRFDEYFGYAPGETLTRERWWREAFPDPGYRAEVAMQWQMVKADALARGGEVAQHEYALWTPNGQRAVVIGGVALSGHLLVTFIDQTEQRAQSDQLRRMAYVDGLTGIANRRQFDLTLKAEWSRGQRSHQPLALLMVDIDRFKDFNDVYGHQQGDDCLRAVAGALQAGLSRPHDVVARYGGEEFACVLPVSGLPGALHIARVLCHRVQALAIAHSGSSVASVVTVSIGVAVEVPGAASSPEQLVARADACLYRAKTAGRNRAVGDAAP